MRFRKGQTVDLNGRGAVVENRLGSGSYASVYQVNRGGERLALKVFHKSRAEALGSAFWQNLGKLTAMGPPGPEYMWPQEAVAFDDGGFGYLMPLAPQGYVSLQSALTQMSWKNRLRFGVSLAAAFRRLHIQGLAYMDVSLNNLFVEPHTGRCAIIDCENISVDGQNVTHVLGTEGFQAPELLRGETSPCVATDDWSLACLLFLLLCSDDPMHGRAWHACQTPDEVAALLRRPVFMFDPDDRSNAADEQLNQTAILCWNLLPHALQDGFVRSFGADGRRLSDVEWGRLLMQLLCEGVECPCGCYLSRSVVLVDENGVARCPFCGHAFRMPPALMAEGWIVSLLPGRQVYRCCVEWNAPISLEEPVGAVCRSKKNPRQLVLGCLEKNGWRMDAQPVAYRQAIPVRRGTQITFASGQKAVMDG